MHKIVLTSLLLISLIAVKPQAELQQELPDSVYSGKQGKLHVQGTAVDPTLGVVYFSFTDKLIKTDLQGNLIGSVTGIVGHLGDLTYDAETGKVYASLEYKNDAIGKGIRSALGVQQRSSDGFYIAVFDGKAITRTNMSAEMDNVMKTIYLKEVVDDYLAEVNVDGRILKHRYACSGIDGITLAPDIEKPNSKKKYIYVAYGIYGDTTRTDNDYQVILKYDISKWDKWGQVLIQDKLHQSGPKKPSGKYHVKTGNTTYGIQNLEYDYSSQTFFAAVYSGKKSVYPNYTLFLIDGSVRPIKRKIYLYGKTQTIKALTLHSSGNYDAATGVRGWHFPWGATGIYPIGDGLFYISHNKKEKDNQQSTTLLKYRWTGDTDNPFVLIHKH